MKVRALQILNGTFSTDRLVKLQARDCIVVVPADAADITYRGSEAWLETTIVETDAGGYMLVQFGNEVLVEGDAPNPLGRRGWVPNSTLDL